MTERGADFDAKREAYEAARAEREWLYDNPDKAISVDEYWDKLKAAGRAEDRAHEAMMGAWG